MILKYLDCITFHLILGREGFEEEWLMVNSQKKN